MSFLMVRTYLWWLLYYSTDIVTHPGAVRAVNTEFLDGQTTGKGAGWVSLVILIAKVHIFHIQLHQAEIM